MNISCLPAERKQKGATQRAGHCFRKFHNTLLAKEVYATMQEFTDNYVFRKERLGSPQYQVVAGEME